MRTDSAARYDGRLRVESAVLGEFEVNVPTVPAVEPGAVDVIWVAIKATQLDSALMLAPPQRVADAAVVPLLNGVDHVDALRRRYRNVVAAAIRVESERVSPGLIRQTSPFLRVEIAGAEDLCVSLRDAGIECRVCEDEATMLWEKLVFLAPIALATAAYDAPLGVVREEPTFHGCRTEAATAARAAGASVDLASIRALHEAAPQTMRSSMQKDVDAGREPELAAIAGPIMRLGREHGFPTTSTESLAARIRGRRP
jgi:2-dehydropantoate 2-reductase